MIIYDLRVDVRQVSLIYLTAGLAVFFCAVWVSPQFIRARLATTLVDAAKPLAFTMIIATGTLGWFAYDARRQADALVELCLCEGCSVVEGAAYDVEKVRQITSGGRFNSTILAGYFKVREQLFIHYPRNQYDYSPSNFLQEGQRVRVYSKDNTLILIEAVD